MDLRRLIRIVRAALEPGGHGFALAGALALNAHGLERATAALDLIYVDEPTAARLFGASQRGELAGEPVLVPSAEHLIAMKVHAIRNDPARRLRDLADVQYLVSLPAVDRQAARRYFEAAGMLDEWDELTKR